LNTVLVSVVAALASPQANCDVTEIVMIHVIVFVTVVAALASRPWSGPTASRMKGKYGDNHDDAVRLRRCQSGDNQDECDAKAATPNPRQL
jgi:hypothetical protein